jgi:hypothetical protein
LSLGVYKYENYRLLEGGLDVSFGGFTWFFFFALLHHLLKFVPSTLIPLVQSSQCSKKMFELLEMFSYCMLSNRPLGPNLLPFAKLQTLLTTLTRLPFIEIMVHVWSLGRCSNMFHVDSKFWVYCSLLICYIPKLD